ncbi:MAG TPA: hypothetical protein VJ673_03150 [Aromatoleum sp.]|uniref:hypothetical protein n=1 Tax=Aromatoleum sp. TaxID=2307007 RepID=UPI002B467426|nr:hypothetical protein [Aromatoleum sp.]HJV24652.1 hypothetical protein [Aromatoleum sp.]
MRSQADEPAAHLDAAEQHDAKHSEHLAGNFDAESLDVRHLAVADVAAGHQHGAAADAGNHVTAPHAGTGLLARQQQADDLRSGR